MTERRRLLLVVGVLGLLVLLFAGGIGAGALRDDGPGAGLHLRERLEGLDPSAAVDPADLGASQGCSVDPAQRAVRISGAVCVLQVPAAGGLPWRGASRTLRLAEVDAGLRVTAEVQGRTVDGDVPSDEPAEIGFGRGVQDVEVRCLPLPPCTASLP